MVLLVIDHGWTIEAAADKFQVDAKTVRKWRDRFLTEDDHGRLELSEEPSAKKAFQEFLKAGRVVSTYAPRFGSDDELGALLRAAVSSRVTALAVRRGSV
jgi:transposase-like protein